MVLTSIFLVRLFAAVIVLRIVVVPLIPF